jgi:predicted DNA-binding transcriptional regulator AlpA
VLSKTHVNTLEPFVTDRQVAELLAVSVRTVQSWRFMNQGPKFIKVGRAVRYRPEDVSNYLASRPGGGTDRWVPRNGK